MGIELLVQRHPNVKVQCTLCPTLQTDQYNGNLGQKQRILDNNNAEVYVLAV